MKKKNSPRESRSQQEEGKKSLPVKIGENKFVKQRKLGIVSFEVLEGSGKEIEIR